MLLTKIVMDELPHPDSYPGRLQSAVVYREDTAHVVERSKHLLGALRRSHCRSISHNSRPNIVKRLK